MSEIYQDSRTDNASNSVLNYINESINWMSTQEIQDWTDAELK